MKQSQFYSVLILGLILSSFVGPAFAAEFEMELTKKEFVEMNVNMIKNAEVRQKEIDQQRITSLKKSMGEKKFQQHLIDTKAAEVENEKKVVSCLGVSQKKFDAFKADMSTEFQADAMAQCATELPDMIKMTNEWIRDNPEIKKYTQCMEKLAEKKSGIPSDKIRSCRQAVQGS